MRALRSLTCVLQFLLPAAALGVPSGPYQLFVDHTLTSPAAPNFDSITDALQHVRDDTDGNTAYHILVYPGVYDEDGLLIDARFVTLEGVSRDAVVIRGDTASTTAALKITRGDVILRNLSFDGENQTGFTVFIDLLNDDDNLVVENCRIYNTERGIFVRGTPTTSQFNHNIVIRDNIIESIAHGLFVDATVGNLNHMDLTLQRNRINVVVGTTATAAILGIGVSRMATTSRFSSLSDAIHIKSSHTNSSPDLQAYYFEQERPGLSFISGAQVTLHHTGRVNSNNGFIMLKMHRDSGTNAQIDVPRAVHVNGVATKIIDETSTSVGGVASLCSASNQKDLVIVSGGTLQWEVNPASGLILNTFVLEDQVEEGYGILYVGTAVDGIQVDPGSPGFVEPLDQGKIKASLGLVGANDTVQIDDLADAPQKDQAETITGVWTHAADLNIGDGSATPWLNFQGGGPDWSMGVSSSGVLYVKTNHSSTTELQFLNDGTGNINYKFDNGFLVPVNDGSTSLGGPVQEFGYIYAHQGYFDTRLEIPQTTSSGTRDALAKHHLLIDQSTGTPRLCAGLDNGSTVLTHCVALTCIESGCP